GFRIWRKKAFTNKLLDCRFDPLDPNTKGEGDARHIETADRPRAILGRSDRSGSDEHMPAKCLVVSRLFTERWVPFGRKRTRIVLAWLILTEIKHPVDPAAAVILCYLGQIG